MPLPNKIALFSMNNIKLLITPFCTLFPVILIFSFTYRTHAHVSFLSCVERPSQTTNNKVNQERFYMTSKASVVRLMREHFSNSEVLENKNVHDRAMIVSNKHTRDRHCSIVLCACMRVRVCVIKSSKEGRKGTYNRIA